MYGRFVESRSRIVMWAKKGTLAIIDQGLISGSNFLIAVLLARWLPPEQYGAFALAFECFVLLYVVYNGLIIEPMSVLGSSTYKDCFREYLGVLLRMQMAAAFITVLLLGGSALVLYEFGGTGSLSQAFLGIMIAAPCMLFFWASRGAMYVRLAPRSAVLGGLLYCAILLSGLVLAYMLQLISPFVAFLTMSVGAVFAAAVLLRRLNVSLTITPESPRLLDVVRQHWVYGRWALSGSVLITASGSMYYPLLGKFRGLAETASLKALLNFSSPIGQLFVAFSLLLLPYAARRFHDEGPASVERLVWRFTSLYSGGAIAYWLVFLIFWEPIVRFLYAGKYMEAASLVPLVALGSVARIAATVQATALRAIQLPALIFVAFCASSAVGFLVGIPSVWAFGLRGAVFATFLSNASAFVIISILLHRNSRRVVSQSAVLLPLVRIAGDS